MTADCADGRGSEGKMEGPEPDASALRCSSRIRWRICHAAHSRGLSAGTSCRFVVRQSWRLLRPRGGDDSPTHSAGVRSAELGDDYKPGTRGLVSRIPPCYDLALQTSHNPMDRSTE